MSLYEKYINLARDPVVREMLSQIKYNDGTVDLIATKKAILEFCLGHAPTQKIKIIHWLTEVMLEKTSDYFEDNKYIYKKPLMLWWKEMFSRIQKLIIIVLVLESIEKSRETPLCLMILPACLEWYKALLPKFVIVDEIFEELESVYKLLE